MGVIWETRALFLNFWKASLRASAEVAVRADRWAQIGVYTPGGEGWGLAGENTHSKRSIHV